jgi:hypothetical protein
VIRIPEAAFMRQNSFGKLWPVSALTLGGGGIGMVWGETTFDECVATVRAAIAAGINLIDFTAVRLSQVGGVGECLLFSS